MNSDVRDILELNAVSSAALQSSSNSLARVNTQNGNKKKNLKRSLEPVKRPEGVHREVWGLMNKFDGDQPPMMPNNEPKLYKHPKANLRYGVRKWHWVDFKNPARTDQAVFSHWRCVNDDVNKEYPFSKFNKQVNLIKYTDAEYAQYLSHDDNWSRAETDHLFELCKRFDLRFYVISDRWDPSLFNTSNKKRNIDELKDRYYKVVGILQKVRQGLDDSQIYVFDFEHEHKRREQLEKLFNRTQEQVEEEIYLMEELKKIETRKKERERKQQEVEKLLTAAVDIDKNAAYHQHQKVPGIKMKNHQSADSATKSIGGVNNNNNNTKRIKQRKLSTSGHNNNKSANNSNNNSLNNSVDNPATVGSPSAATDSKGSASKKLPTTIKAVVESTGIKFPDGKTVGVTLRSHKMKLPQSVGLKKIKVIEQILNELQMEHKPIATENITEQFNELRSDIVLLYELQQALTNLEFELQSLKVRFEAAAPGKPLDLPIFDNAYPNSSSTLFTSLNNSTTMTNTPQKRITEIFDSSLTPTVLSERRRRAAASNQTNIIKKLRGRNPI